MRATGALITPTSHRRTRRPLVAALVVALTFSSTLSALAVDQGSRSTAHTQGAKPKAGRPLVFFPSFGSNVVAVYDPRTNRMIKYIGMQAKGASVAYVSPDQKTVYVLAGAAATVTEVDTRSLTVRRVIPFDGPIGDRGTPLPDDGRHFWIANIPGGDIQAIDTKLHKVTRSFAKGGNVFTPSRDGRWIYVVNGDGFQVHDARNFQLVSSVPLPHSSGITAMPAPDGKHVYLVGGADNGVPLGSYLYGFVDVVDVTHPRAPRITNSIQTGSYTFNAEFTPDGRQLWVLSSGDGSINVIDLATNKIVRTIQTGRLITAITFSGDKALLVQDPRPIPPTYATAFAITIGGPFPGALVTPESGEASTRPVIDWPSEIAVYDRFTYERTNAPTTALPSMVFTPATVTVPTRS